MLRTNNWRKAILLVLAGILVITLMAGCGKKEESGGVPGAGEGKTIATYKDGVVTDKEFKLYSTFFGVVQPQTEMYLSIPQLQEQFLREYIGYKILFKQLGDKKQTDEEKKNVDTFYTQLKQSVDADAATKKKVDDAGLKESDIRYFFTMISTIMKEQESKVTDDQVKKQYDATKDDYNVVSVRHILISTVDLTTGAEKRKDADALKIAKEVKAQLDAGGDWTALAKKYSEDQGSKDNGGLYENQPAKSWVAEFKEAANKQPIGKVGDPVKTQYGYHVMKVEKRTPTAFDKLTADDKAQLKSTLASTNLNKYMTDELPKLITKIDLPKTETPATDSGSNAGGTTNTNKDANTNTNTNADKKTETK
ncbi:peptidylprolyl isomerase [Paenibacillus sp. OV219]|uniref:peptidylprolyl isomerase n=1 Tax=Paenibacillus sp. OV219 TaxID=1884377 RepID=UPI0008CB47AF|nr:peptidylprolyl isomerase [Paenibacillus sp. OV219]SEP06016.1 foldase protein PrsA [Paenibacillus sp. OV219]